MEGSPLAGEELSSSTLGLKKLDISLNLSTHRLGTVGVDFDGFSMCLKA